MKRMRAAGYEIGNIDSTIIAQKPKLSPHKARSIGSGALSCESSRARERRSRHQRHLRLIGARATSAVQVVVRRRAAYPVAPAGADPAPALRLSRLRSRRTCAR